MKCLSFNCRGLASSNKKLAFKRLIGSERIDVILLQETLGDGISINKILLKMLPDWNFHSLDVRGRSKGCVLGFNNETINVVNIWVGEGFLGADLKATDINEPLRLINIYGPFHNMEAYWDKQLGQISCRWTI